MMTSNLIDNRSIRAWLSSMGYELDNEPQARVAELFYQEARQWELAPDDLRRLVETSYRAHYSIEFTTRPIWMSLAEV